MDVSAFEVSVNLDRIPVVGSADLHAALCAAARDTAGAGAQEWALWGAQR
jgi:hypothetical protein